MIFDAFLFRDEFTCLDVRLHELREIVDCHLLVETDWTFQGGQKPLHFTNDHFRAPKRRGSKPIRAVRKMGDPYPHGSTWAREAYTRELILEGLAQENAADDDLVLLSDVDELPAADAIGDAIAILNGQASVAFKQEPRFYRFDNLCINMDYKGSQIAAVGSLRRNGVERIRENRWTAPHVEGGWHFCNLGDAENFIRKLQSYAHDEHNTPERTDREAVEKMIRNRELMDDDDKYDFVLTDEGLPEWVLENRAELAEQNLFYERVVAHA